MKLIRYILCAVMLALLVACGGGGGSPGSNGQTVTSSTPTVTLTVTGTVTAQVSSLSIRSSSNQVRSDGSTTATIIVNALDAQNGLLSGADVKLSASSGVLSASSGVTDANGQVSFVFSAGVTDRSNRVATIAVSSNGKTAETQVKISGGTVTLDSGNVTTLLVGGTPAILSVTVRDVAGTTVGSGVRVTFESNNQSVITLNAATATTNASGVATITVAALSAGSAKVSASSNGITAVQDYSVTSSGSGFYISLPAAGIVITTGSSQVVSVVASGVSNVTFATPLGVFANGSQSQTVPVVGGVATVVFSSAIAGDASITAFDPTASNIRTTAITIKVSPPVSSANKILLSANKTNVSISTGTTQNTIQIKARAIFNANGIDVGVFNVPILFSMTGGPGAGESLSQAIGFTDSSGNVTTTFIAGSQATTQNGILVHAQILGSGVSTSLLPSNSDLILTIGGQALSVVFAPGTKIIPSDDNTYYELPMSAQVTDANGNAVAKELLSLSIEPFAYSTGFNACAGAITGSYCSEDLNSNGSLDSAEDGVRRNYLASTATCSATTQVGTSDGLLTPPNSAAGSVPSTIVTNDAGVAPFKITYLKGNATWVVVKLTATVSSAGTESSFTSIFRLSPSAEDAKADPCPLPPSPYKF
jgi:Bacterial Ig-like domain (group 1)